jgi:hypothetical protein
MSCYRRLDVLDRWLALVVFLKVIRYFVQFVMVA